MKSSIQIGITLRSIHSSWNRNHNRNRFMSSYSSSSPIIKINPPSTVQRLPLSPKDGFKSNQELEEFSKSIRLKDYIPSFSTSVQTLALRIPASQANSIIKRPELQGLIFNSLRISPIHPDPQKDSKFRVLQLNLPIPLTSTSTSTSTNPSSNFKLEDLIDISSELQSLIKSQSLHLIPHSIPIDFSYFTTEQVLHSTLPISLLQNSDGVPTSFTSTGHIAHLNLRTNFLPYKNFIGDLILEKNKSNIKTVVNKLDSIDNVYRFFEMELLSGENQFKTILNENDVVFEFDFRKVYWNSRLGTEHSRIIDLIKPYEVLIDVMAGVGPFSLPTAKNGGWVWSNDLNPDSFESLKMNSEKNGKVVKSRMIGIENIDGREFVKKSAKKVWEKGLKGERIGFDRIKSWKLDCKDEKERYLKEKKLKIELGRQRKLEKEKEKTLSQNNNGNGNGDGEGKGKANEIQSQLKDLSIRDNQSQIQNSEHRSTNQINQESNPIKNSSLTSTSTSISTIPFSSDSNSKSNFSSSSQINETPPQEIPRNPSLLPDRYILNLPDSALTFLDSFTGSWLDLRNSIGSEILEKELKRRKETYGYEFPLVHVHCFTKETQSVESSHRDVCQRANHYLSLTNHPAALRPPSDSNPTPELSLHLVRAVAPNKNMYCLTFRLTREILFDEK